jgi:hypothetical protein
MERENLGPGSFHDKKYEESLLKKVMFSDMNDLIEKWYESDYSSKSLIISRADKRASNSINQVHESMNPQKERIVRAILMSRSSRR